MIVKKIIGILAVFMAVAMISIAFTPAVQAKYVDLGELTVKNISEIQTATSFEKINNMYRGNYFKENGFRWYNYGDLSIEKSENTTSEIDWIQGFSGYLEKLSWSKTDDMTTPDKHSIALQAGKSGSGDEGFLTQAGFIGKNCLSMHKGYPAYVALPDTDYYFNSTIKVAKTEYIKHDAGGGWAQDHYEISFPILASALFSVPSDTINATLLNTGEPLTAKGLMIMFHRTAKENPDITNSNDFKELALTLFEFENVGETQTVENSVSWRLDWLTSEDSWVHFSSSFTYHNSKWFYNIRVTDMGTDNLYSISYQDYEIELKAYTEEDNINLCHLWFSQYTTKDAYVSDWEIWWADWGGWVGLIVACVIAGLVVFFSGGLAAPIAVFIVAAALGLTVGLLISFSAQGTMQWISDMSKQLGDLKAALQDLIAQIFGGKAMPDKTFVSYIDKVTVEYGNVPPDIFLTGVMCRDDVNITDIEYSNREYGITPYDWVECDGNSSIDTDGSIDSMRFFLGVEKTGVDWTHNLVTNSTPGIVFLNESGGGKLRINPKDYSDYSTGTVMGSNTTFDKYMPVKIDMKSVGFDNENGFGLGFGNPNEFPKMFDGSITYSNGTIEVIWMHLFARLSPKYINHNNIESICFSAEGSQYRDNYHDNYNVITDAIVETHGIIYSWSFGDGTTGTGKTVYHKYSTPGIYTVTLTISDKDGNTDIAFGEAYIFKSISEPISPGWYEDMPWWFWYAMAGIIGAGGIGAVMMATQQQKGGKVNEE